MRVIAKNLLFMLCLALFLNQANAKPMTCPSVEQIKTVKFVRAHAFDDESKLWELISSPFVHEGKTWNISFGVTLPVAETETAAIEAGSKRYIALSGAISSTPTDPIPSYLFCDYTHVGQDYWIQAFSPY